MAHLDAVRGVGGQQDEPGRVEHGGAGYGGHLGAQLAQAGERGEEAGRNGGGR